MTLSIIVAMSENRVIGKDNAIPWHLPGDLPRFKRITMGHPIIMGRKNYESIGRVLPGRTNIIITRQADYHIDGAIICSSVDEALAQCDGEQEIFIIGGGEIYTQTIDRADRIYLTTIHEHVDGNVYFPEFDEADFVQIEREDYNAPVQHSFMVLERSGD
jgi:dihydrofolate reductase